MTEQELLQQSDINFPDVMQVIADNYQYQATAFKNGDTYNEAGTNEGSCKLFAFAQMHGLDEAKTLALFGQFYQDVLATPEGDDHANIRNFMKTGWAGIAFEGTPLTKA